MSTTNPVIVFHGQQGSGKSSWSERVVQFLKEQSPITAAWRPQFSPIRYGIKSTFSELTELVFSMVGIDPSQHLFHYKEYQRHTSTCFEGIEPTIWSNKFHDKVVTEYKGHAVVMDDCRSKMNLDALRHIAESGRQVLFFALHADEEIRKQRVSAWRPPVDYTEQMLSQPSELPESFKWVDVDTNGDKDTAWETIHSTFVRELGC